MTTDRLAALLRSVMREDVPYNANDADILAARLAAQGVTVGLDVERLARILHEDSEGEACPDWPECEERKYYLPEAIRVARAYAATPQPDEEE